MSIDTYNWLRVGHVFGFVCWIAGLTMVLQLLRIHSTVEGAAREVLQRQERKAAVVMDAGATLAIICGFWLALGGVNQFKQGAWLHIKLTIVVIFILGMHGWARVQIKRFRQGKVRPVSSVLIAVVLIAAAAAITLGANHYGIFKK
ncbi:MAG TPA: CopD family protein [Kofleriaceae bacterium]|nr:CopD family protein [Kofleriaceae bacterium]